MLFGRKKSKTSPRLCYSFGNEEYARKNYKEALRYFQLAAEGGVHEALHRMGREYEAGVLVARDIPRAISFYRQAIEHGGTDAHISLYLLYMSMGEEQNALQTLREGAEKEARSHNYSLGISFYLGSHLYSHGESAEAERLFDLCFTEKEDGGFYRPRLQTIRPIIEKYHLPFHFKMRRVMALYCRESDEEGALCGDAESVVMLVRYCFNHRMAKEAMELTEQYISHGNQLPELHYINLKFLRNVMSAYHERQLTCPLEYLDLLVYHRICLEKNCFLPKNMVLKEYKELHKALCDAYIGSLLDREGALKFERDTTEIIGWYEQLYG